ncbi:hypothetical protein PR048_003417, partial [Dryococelus australis]
MELKHTKIGYLLNYGIAPYFERELEYHRKKASEIVVGFDESLKKVAQREQMDIHVRFWDEDLKKVTSRYLTLVFLTSAQAQDLLKGLKCDLGHENLRKTIQISMDGPSVNWKLRKDLQQELDHEGFDLINIDSGGLHVVHGAFKEGRNEEDRMILKGSLFSFQGCSSAQGGFHVVHRWVENKKVADRAHEILPHLQVYVEAVEKQTKDILKQKNPQFKRSLPALKEFRNFKLLCPKLIFLSAAASITVPFLREFQTDNPMAPFLHQDLRTLTTNVLQRVSGGHRFCHNRCLKESLKSEAQILLNRDCLELLVEKQQIPGSVTDKVLEEYREFCQIASVTEALKSFHCHSQHLDEVYMQTVLECGKSFPSLLQFFKHLLILSHGNAALKRGFPVNADCLVENQTEEKGVENIKITKSLIHYATNSSSRYKEHLASKREKEVALKMEKDRKRQVKKALKELHVKKAKIMSVFRESR